MSDKPAAAPAPTPTDDLLAIAEVVGNIKDRFERLEAEHATQSAPLAAATQALQAALAGLAALKSHVLENSITVLSTRVEDQRRAIDEQVSTLVAELRAADQQAAQFTRSESDAIRASLAELRGHFERTAREFSARAERFDAEIKTAATRFAALPAAPGRDGASFTPAGTWSASQVGGYKRLSVVSYMGGSYLSNEDENTEKPGPKSLKWTQLAARGPGGGSGDISGLTGVAGVTQGGTGLNSYTTGDILYASSSTTLAKLGAGAAGQFLVSNGAGTAPSWGTGTSGALPSMTGNADKILTTDGTNASWLATDSITTVLRTTNTTAATNTTSGAFRVGANVGLSGNSGGPSYFGGTIVSSNQLICASGYQFRSANDTFYELLRYVGGSANPGLYVKVTESSAHVTLTASGSSVPNQKLRLGAEAVDGVLEVAGTGVIAKVPSSALSLATNGTMTFELTSNTSLTIKARGSDGTTRSVALTLA